MTDNNWYRCVLIALLSIFIYVPEAHAYIDPGSGSMILQAIVASIAAGFAFFGVFWQRIKARFFSTKSDVKKDETDDETK